jgi:hypothetical protein
MEKMASLKDFQATGEAFSPQREHPALRKMKFINFFFYFQFLLVIFALSDPDPNPDFESRSGYRDPIESGSKPDSDQQHCF